MLIGGWLGGCCAGGAGEYRFDGGGPDGGALYGEIVRGTIWGI